MKARILVVDDNPDSLAIMRTILENHGYEVVAAGNGTDGLAVVRSTPVDLVLLDVMMPDMSGIEVLQQIKLDAATGCLPVILVTAKTHDDDLLSGYEYGADYYIPKPFTAKQLLYGIELVLGQGGGGE
jgi:DNA-binding response OmpR family regulator